MEHQSLEQLIDMMEEMAGGPREEYGKRTPGEKCMYEKYRADDTLAQIEKMNVRPSKAYQEWLDEKARWKPLLEQIYPKPITMAQTE